MVSDWSLNCVSVYLCPWYSWGGGQQKGFIALTWWKDVTPVYLTTGLLWISTYCTRRCLFIWGKWQGRNEKDCVQLVGTQKLTWQVKLDGMFHNFGRVIGDRRRFTVESSSAGPFFVLSKLLFYRKNFSRSWLNGETDLHLSTSIREPQRSRK